MMPLAARTNCACVLPPSNVVVDAGVAVMPVPGPAEADEATAMIASAATATARMIFFKWIPFGGPGVGPI
jgi:hypothetical protein